MTDRSGDRLRQADADLKHAEFSIREGDFEWACFAAQHSLLVLLQSLPEEILAASGPDLLDSGRALDKQYIPTRYPNGFSMGAPLDYFTERDACESLSHAKSILEFCRTQIRRS